MRIVVSSDSDPIELICPSGVVPIFLSSPLLQKYFASPVGQIISTTSRHPTPQEGRVMIVRNAGWVAVDAAAFCVRWDGRAGDEPVSDHRHADERCCSVRQNRV